MEWCLFAAPVPGAVDFGIGTIAACVALLTACVPLVVAARHALGLRLGESETPQLRVVEGGKELGQRAA
jgi:hypothetical protein